MDLAGNARPIAITAAAFALNAVFAFAIAGPDHPPAIRPAFRSARAHRRVVRGSGALIGLVLGLSAIVVPGWGKPWFTLSMGVVIGVMMVPYVAVPSRLIGVNPKGSKRDKLAASASAERSDRWCAPRLSYSVVLES